MSSLCWRVGTWTLNGLVNSSIAEKMGFSDRPPAFRKDRLRLKLYKLKYHPKIAIIQRVPLLATRWFAFIWFLFTCLVLPTIIQFRKLTTSMFFSSRFVSGLLQLWSYKINSEKNGQVPRWYQYKWMVICVFLWSLQYGRSINVWIRQR